jgi:dTDP-glucose pyrophosphorylase
MIDISKILLRTSSTIEDALNIINLGAVRIALVVDADGKLLGTLSDGDIRRGLLRKVKLNDTIKDAFSKNPATANIIDTRERLLQLCLKNGIGQLPIVDNSHRVVDLFLVDSEFYKKNYENQVVLMVGGLGMRLRPLTDNTPKPMLHVGGRPILQTIVKGFVDSGFTNITMCLGYKSNVIQNYFEDGSDFGANIDYIVEEKRMGTAGALSLLKKEISKPFFVMNGDLLASINYKDMLDFHEESNSKATMCIREYDIKVPYGVVSVNNEEITSIKEKPIHSFFVNAGVYLLGPECIDLIPSNKFYDMPSLFEKMILNKRKITSFPLKEYWLDIGRMDDYHQANNDYFKQFKV